MQLLKFILLYLFITIPVFGQSLTQWKNLKIDLTTPDEAISILGKPKKDKINNNETNQTDSSGAKIRNNYRRMDFRNIDEYKEVFLIFIDNKLVQISLTPDKKKILASNLETLFDTNFLFLEGFPKGLKFAEYEGQKETTVPKVYPSKYYMLGVKSEIGIIGVVDNNSWKAIWRDSIKKPTSESYPGYIQNIGIFSRRSEKK